MTNFVAKLLTASAVVTASALNTMTSSAQTFPKIADEVLNSYPTYAGEDLELTVDSKGTHFRLWSPGADAVKLNIYEHGRNGKPIETVEMTKSANGTWSKSFAQELQGKL